MSISTGSGYGAEAFGDAAGRTSLLNRETNGSMATGPTCSEAARRTAAVIVAASAALLACTVGPDYVRPAVETPPAFKEQWKLAQPRDTGPRGNWWEVFGDSTLNDLAAQVDINNQNIKVAEANVREARALTAQARAAFFPTVTGGASATRGSSGTGRSGTSASAVTGGGASRASNAYSLDLDATSALDLWGRVRRIVEATQASTQAGAEGRAG